MNTSTLSRSTGRALGLAFAFVLTLAAVPAHAQSLTLVSSTIGLPGTALTDPNEDQDFPAGVVFFHPVSSHINQNSVLGQFDFSSVVANNQLPTAIGDVGISLSVYSLNTLNPPANGGNFNELELELNGTGANSGLHLLTGIFLNGFASSEIDTESFNYATTGAQGSSILSFLNQTGGVITASIDDLNTALNQTDGFVGGTMTLAFSVPFSPVQWLGIAAILLMAVCRIGWRRVPALVGL